MSFKIGDKVKIYLDEEIKQAESGRKKDQVCLGVLKLWKAINGKKGIITSIKSENEVWVRGNNTGMKRMFSFNTLKRLE